jgi:hypothetical protein
MSGLRFQYFIEGFVNEAIGTVEVLAYRLDIREGLAGPQKRFLESFRIPPSLARMTSSSSRTISPDTFILEAGSINSNWLTDNFQIKGIVCFPFSPLHQPPLKILASDGFSNLTMHLRDVPEVAPHAGRGWWSVSIGSQPSIFL